jgi:hypothetical protein
MVDRPVREAAVRVPLALLLRPRPGQLDLLAVPRLRHLVRVDELRGDVAQPVAREEREQVVRERPLEIDERLLRKAFGIPTGEPLAGELMEGLFLPRFLNNLQFGRLPDAMANVGEHVGEFHLSVLPRCDVQRQVVTAPVGAEPDRESPAVLSLTFDDLPRWGPASCHPYLPLVTCRTRT